MYLSVITDVRVETDLVSKNLFCLLCYWLTIPGESKRKYKRLINHEK